MMELVSMTRADAAVVDNGNQGNQLVLMFLFFFFFGGLFL
jgi:hypothetical protein